MVVVPVGDKRAPGRKPFKPRLEALGYERGIHALLSTTALACVMDMSLVSAILGAQSGMTQLGVATDVLRMNADNAGAIVKLLDAANQSAKSLANVAAGIGANLDVTA